jgi:hypothetical protein
MIPEKGTKQQIKEFVLRLFQHRVVCHDCRVKHDIHEFYYRYDDWCICVMAGQGSLCEVCGEDNGGMDMLCAYSR